VSEARFRRIAPAQKWAGAVFLGSELVFFRHNLTLTEKQQPKVVRLLSMGFADASLIEEYDSDFLTLKEGTKT
jgi:hypothetical protein